MRQDVAMQSAQLGRQYAVSSAPNEGLPKVFLLAAWNTADEYRYAQLYPEAWGMDSTSQTNNEKRDLLTVYTKDGFGNVRPILRMLLPNEKRYIFDIAYR